MKTKFFGFPFGVPNGLRILPVFSVYETYRPDTLEPSARLLRLAVLPVLSNKDVWTTSFLLFLWIYRIP